MILLSLVNRIFEKKSVVFVIFFYVHFFSATLLPAQKTERVFLSGKGNDDTINWEFFCTGGRNSGIWTSIPVPSCWECEGFGTYNYGHDKDETLGKEKGLYRYYFTVPRDWQKKTVKIVFEGSMTDTEVKINGKVAGSIHQGAFYKFSYNITKLLKYGTKNLLEVTVAKHSANESVNEAERRCDYWIFGGIFRPVYLEAKPKEHIDRIALDAKADGNLKVGVYLDMIRKANRLEVQVKDLNGELVGKPFTTSLEKGVDYELVEGKIQSPDKWTPETPHLYVLELKLMNGDKVLHWVSERFGFRTVEIKERDGVYVNGVKVKFKGINRHSFWPTSGRTTSKQISINDVNLIKDMNMNAVRMSHYPPDSHFLDVCDSLGLFVLDELAGWQTAYDTDVGSELAKEMISRDVNHPSVVIWDNGNEGGWNEELDHWFDELDPQKRPLIHPYQVFRETDTDHYQDYDARTGVHQHGSKVVFPTEFLHGLYDGGHGAGLEDYWEQMWHNPISAGGFLWDFSDQAVVRTDKEGQLDTDGNHGADGILGPYREKEASYYTVKEIWAPIFFEKRFITPEFNGQFIIENRYHYTNLKDCIFTYQLVSPPLPGETKQTINYEFKAASPHILPNHRGILQLDLPKDFSESDVLFITATDPSGREIYTWSWPISLPLEIADKIIPINSNGKISIDENNEVLTLTANSVKISWNKETGLLRSVENEKGIINFNNGPLLIGEDIIFKGFNHFKDKNGNYNITAEYEGAFKKVIWTLYPNGWLQFYASYYPPYKSDFTGISFNYPEEEMKGMRWMGYGPYRVWKNRLKGNRLDVWEKAYNNTITGESGYIYPEFKGYHKDFYWVTIQSGEQDFDIITTTEDIFLRMFTPASPMGMDAERISPPFPVGSVSFMHGINPIGTKILAPEKLGPSSQKNIFLNRRKEYTKEIELYFNFTGKRK